MSIDDKLHWLVARYMASPQWFKHVVGGGYALLPRPFRHGPSYRHYRKVFSATNADPEYVRSSLALTVQTALRSVPAFGDLRHLLADAERHPFDVLRLLPLMEKADIKKDLGAFLSRAKPERDRLKMFTGGSTSIPMTFYGQVGVSRAKELAAFDAMADRFGTEGDGVILALRGRTVPTAGTGRMWMYEPIKRQLVLSSDHLEPRFMKQYVEALQRWRPRYIQAFPSALYPLITWLRENGFESTLAHVRCVTLVSESVFQHHLTAFRQFFQCPVLVTYGHTERVLLANTLPDDSRYHFWPHYGYFELIDPEGRPVTQPGRVGEIVGTGFDNLVMPFVRYRTGDYAVLGESPHTLMAGSPVVDRIEGRLQEFVVCADHRLVTVTTIGAAHVQELERCLRIQYEQFEPGRLILRVVSMQPLDADSKARVCRAIEHKTQGGCSVEVQEVDHIELTGRGKQRLLVQHLDVGRYLGSALTGSVSSASPDNLLPATAPEPLPHSKKTETTLPLDKPAWTIPSVFPAFRGSIELVGKELQLLTRHVTRRAILAKRRANLLTAGERDDQQRLRERQIKLLADSVNSAIRRIPRFRPLGPVPADGSIFEVLRRNVQLTNKAHLLSDRSLLYPNGGRRRPWWPVGKTSGTSGTPLEVFRDIDSVVWEEAFHIQSWRWAGVEPNEPQAVLRGDLAGLSEANAGRYSLWDPFGSQLFLATRSLSGRSVAAMIAACQTYRCVALRAYPSAADQLAKLVEETGSRLCFKSVITSSEPLYPVQRERIERVFGCKVLNIYGMAERVAYATECEHGHLHLNTDYSFVEILDEAGQATDDFGSIVGTSFRNQVMPLLRYKLSDKARWMPGACLCGRTYPRIELASGKVEDQLFDRDGGAVNSSIVTFAFKGVDNIAKAQVAQVDPHRWEIRIVPGRGFSKRDSDRLLSNLNHYVSSRVAYAIRVVDDIPAQQSGKYKWIAQEWVRN